MIAAGEKQNRLLARTVQLADRLVADIRCRNLEPGDSYMTAQEASRFLGVAGAAANRALQILEKRRIICRSQRRGAIILEPPKPECLSIDHVHFLVHDKYYRTEGVGGDGVLLGIQDALPTSIVSHCFLSSENEVSQVTRLIEQAYAEESTIAFVMVRAPFAVQQMISASGLPAVVYGSVYDGVPELSQIDRDHAGAVRLAVEFLQKRRRTRLAVLLRQQIMPGDFLTLDALTELSGFALTLRSLPSVDENIEAVALSILSRSEPPDAFLCQTARQAECVERIRRQLNISSSGVDIAVLTTYLKSGEEIPFPHIELDIDPEETGRRLGKLLLERASGNPPTRVVLPVRLAVPPKIVCL